MAIAVPDDVRIALKKASLTAAESAKIQQDIDTVSDWVLNKTGYNFGVVTATYRLQADGNGDIKITRFEPVSAINTVLDIKSQVLLSPSPGTGPQVWYFDGLECIYGFYPRQVLDINLTYGDPTVPPSIRGVVVESVKRSFLNPKNLVARQVADVSEEYGPRQHSALYLSDNEIDMLEAYQDTEMSWALEIRPDYPDPREYYKSQFWPNGPWL